MCPLDTHNTDPHICFMKIYILPVLDVCVIFSHFCCRHSELSEVCSSISEHDSSFGETLEERLYVFEAHPARNRVLSLADRIRDMLKLLKDGAHATSNDVTCLEDPDGCCSNDIDVLRRQLRKMRRWQQNVVHFVTDDVVDLELIIGAIEKHIWWVENLTFSNHSLFYTITPL